LDQEAEWRIPQTKKGEAHIASLVPQAIEILKKIKNKQTSEWVFPSSASKFGHVEEPQKAWQRVWYRAGISALRLHNLRQTLASLQIRTGANSFIIGKILGHKSQQATDIYARVSKDVARTCMKNAANEMFKYNKRS
jgi:integrase